MEQNNLVAHNERPEVFQKVDTKKRFIPILVVVCLVVGFFFGFQYNQRQTNTVNAVAPEDVDLTAFWSVWNLLHENYVGKGDLQSQALLDGAIEGMVNSIGDPYTVFFPPEESKAFAEQIQGAFGGVGIEIGLRDGILTVIAPIKDTPAARAGLIAGDKILKIDDTSTEGMNINEAVNKIRGPKGTDVVLTIAHESLKSTKEVTLTRDTIKIPAVAWEMKDNNIAYLQVYVFNQNVDQEFQKAAVEISKSDAHGIVLDLRNNPGGLLSSAVDLAGYFLDEGSVVTIQRDGDGQETLYNTERNGLLKNYPVVILMNKGSASASEILAGTLRDNRNISIIGETSFGKGSVQDIFNLPRGASVKITFAKWFTPNGDSINEQGITPNINIERTEDDFKNNLDPQLNKALEVIKTLI